MGMMEARGLSRIGILSAAAVAGYVFEALLPTPLPFARIGVSNVFVVIALFGFGSREAVLVNMVRVLAGSMLLGFTFSPAFILSVSGSMSAVGIMALIRWRAVPPLSVIGTSAAGAAANNLTQVVLFSLLFARWPIPGGLVGGFLLLGAGVGLVTGLLAAMALKKVVLERARQVN
jgi:heptaprenyl diphosphate synthase